MQNNFLLKLGAWAGIIHVVVEIIGLSFSLSARKGVVPGSSIADVYKEFSIVANSSVWVGRYLEILAFLIFIFFISRLYSFFKEEGQEKSGFSLAGFGFGLLYVGITLIDYVAKSTLDFRSGPEINAQLATALFDLGGFLYILSWLVAAFFVITNSIVIMQTKTLPKWLASFGIVTGLGLVLGVLFPFNLLSQIPPLLVFVWVLGVSISLLRRKTLI